MEICFLYNDAENAENSEEVYAVYYTDGCKCAIIATVVNK